jgi:hypothetical protein
MLRKFNLGLLAASSALLVIGFAPLLSHAADTREIKSSSSMKCVADSTCPACKSGEAAARCTYTTGITACVCLPAPTK